MRQRAGGFTLIELMIVVVIIGILGAIALPTYQSYVLRGNRTVARTAMLRIATLQENFYADRKQFATSLRALSTDYKADTIHVTRDGRLKVESADAMYAVTLTGASATAWTITATPLNAQLRDTTCGTLSYASTGTMAASGTGTDCWTR